jgi:hypothetical protein
LNSWITNDTLAGILPDFGVTTNLLPEQRVIFIQGEEHRSRLHGLYMATFFARARSDRHLMAMNPRWVMIFLGRLLRVAL